MTTPTRSLNIDAVSTHHPMCSGDMRMTVSLFSYAGKVTVGFLTDAGVVSDPQPLADAFRAELLAPARRSRRIVG